MMKSLLFSMLIIFFAACSSGPTSAQQKKYPVTKTEAEWKKLLTTDQFNILRKRGTEPPFRNAYWDNKDKGIYVCAGCDQELFSSETKFNSGTGWPSFYAPINPKNVEVAIDNSYGMVRDEISCTRCGGHLGHLFNDGPQPTGLRYCINSGALKFIPK